VERCGSDLNLPLVLAPYAGSLLANTHAIAFCSSSGEHQPGIFLPSLRRLTFTAPSAPGGCGSTVLGPRRLYYVTHRRVYGRRRFRPSLPPLVVIGGRSPAEDEEPASVSLLFRRPRSGVQAVMSMQEHPLEAGRKAGRAVAADRRRRGVSEGSVELPPEQMRAVLAENGVTAGQSVAFLRAFWHGVTTA
jgi:hypothetical protein